MAVFSTSREIPAPPHQVFAAISEPQRLARWWGPAGFTNTFAICEFRVGGRWSFVMHGPDGARYPNESEFAEIEAPGKIVVQHVSEPRFRLTIMLALLSSLFLYAAAVVAEELHSYALVQDDGSLLIKGRIVHLDGIYLPPTGRQCLSEMRPVRCAERAVLALEFRIQGFVHCFVQSVNEDDSRNATCYVDRGHFDEGENLSAYLIRNGWAVALPDAPFEYQALEAIARKQGAGVWGFPADVIRRP